MTPLSKEELTEFYLKQRKSAHEIASIFGCSENKVNYWIRKHEIPKRSVSEAVYIKCNPKGDPFVVKKPQTVDEAILYGLGIGLYWGEGTKSSKHTIRLGNTDPKLIKRFIDFLEMSYSIDRKKLRFGLQIFSDMSPKSALRFWKDELDVSINQFQKVIVTPARSIGTYRNKTQHGVLTVHFNNRKLRDILYEAVEGA